MSTERVPVRKGGRALPLIVGAAAAALVGFGVLIVPGLLSDDAGDGGVTPGPSGTLASTSPGASTGPGGELPPLVGEATRASILNDSSLAGVDLGGPVSVAVDPGFPVYALTDEVRAAMGPGWSLWLASEYGEDESGVGPELFISSPGGTVFDVASLGGIALDEEGLQALGGVSDWFPPAQEAFVYVTDVDAASDILVDLTTGAEIVGPSDSEGWGGGSWRLVGTRDDGTQVWVEYYNGDGAPEETWNLHGIELRSPTGEWSSVVLDYTGLYHGVAMDPTGVYAIAMDYGHMLGSQDAESLGTARDVAVIDTVAEVRTNYHPLWPAGSEWCEVLGWLDDGSFRVSCWADSESGGPSSEQRDFRIFLDGSTPEVVVPDPYAGLDDVVWRSSTDGLLRILDEGSTDVVELDLDRDGTRIRILDLARLSEIPGLESAAAGAEGFEVWTGASAGGSLILAEGLVGTMLFCVAVDSEALTYDIVSLGSQSEQNSNSARRCGESGTAYYAWP